MSFEEASYRASVLHDGMQRPAIDVQSRQVEVGRPLDFLVFPSEVTEARHLAGCAAIL